MKFNEKLIELRKKGGLSQEELGYKFNVTRQTVSKWELGQTTPEMDKLVEMSKFFNVSVDELINDTEINQNENTINDNVVIEDQKVEDKGGNNKRTAIIIAIVVLVFILLAGSLVKTAINPFRSIDQQIENANEQADGIFGFFNKVLDIANKQLDEMEETENETNQMGNEVQSEMNNNFGEIFNQVQDAINQTQNETEVNSFNGKFEIHEGIIKGASLKSLLSDIITNNRKETKIITVVFEGQSATDAEQIKNILSKIDTFTDYDVYFEYDEEGYIQKANILNM